MLRTVLALLSTVQFGARIKESVDRSLRQAAVAAVAIVFLLAAATFGLIAAYHALVSLYQFTPGEAAAIMAAALFVAGLIVLFIASRVGAARKRPSPSRVTATGDGAGLVDQGVDKMVQQIGPVPLIAIAFLAGVLAARR
jgi:uncharacterized membrane protein